MTGEKNRGQAKSMGAEKESYKTAKGRKAESDREEKPKKKSAMKSKKSGKSSKEKKLSGKKEIQKEEKPTESRSTLKKSSKEKKAAGREKKGRKVVPGWGLTRGVHPPRFNLFLIQILP